MIVNQVRGDIFSAPQKHIAFAVNTQGYNDSGFAGQVSSRIWPNLAGTGGNELGEVLTHKNGNKTYHALVCHSLDSGGWDAHRASLGSVSTRSTLPTTKKSPSF